MRFIRSHVVSSTGRIGRLASAYAISVNYVAKHLPLALLAPAIVDAILDDQRQESRKAGSLVYAAFKPSRG
jgi:hypothetical protein